MATRETTPAPSAQTDRAGQPGRTELYSVYASAASQGEALLPGAGGAAPTIGHTSLPSFSVELLRPDDLLTLHVEGYNLAPPDPGTHENPAQLTRIEPNADAFLAFTFPPQHIAEQAYFETSNVSPKDHPDTTSGKPSVMPDPPGTAGSRMSGPTRLVFRLSPDVNQIPCSTEGLLDWSRLEPALAPVALMAERPTAAQLAAAPPIERPGAFATAIELPYRLFLSPGPEALWQHVPLPVTHAGRTELWHTRMVLPEHVKPGTGKSGKVDAPGAKPEPVGGGFLELTAQQSAPLRAIWSPDYVPPSQAMPDHTLHYPPFLSSLSERDRHQIVVLTSAFTGYSYDHPAQPFVPSPIHAQRVMLSSLGGWLSSRGAWEHQPYSSTTPSGDPVKIRIARRPSVWSRLGDVILWPVRGVQRIFQPRALTYARATTPGVRRIPILWRNANPAQILDMSEWVHLATQGRDHYVKVVYEGHLLPFGHRAALVKITERKFQTVATGPLAGAPVAWLRQHMFVVVREPEKHYDDAAALSRTNQGRAMPLRTVRLKTLVTPDIVYPYSGSITPNSQVAGTTGSFWIRVMRGGAPTDFSFSVSATDVEGKTVEFTTPMIFVEMDDSGNSKSLDALRNAYTNDPDPERRACVVAGQKMAFARASGPGKGDTDLTTSRLYFGLKPFPAQPEVPAGFLPVLEKARVSVPALEHLMGLKDPVTISLAQSYLDHDFDAHAGVFAQLDPAGPLAVKFTADQAGGICTPNLSVAGISRALGPVAGDLNSVMSGAFKPGQYFPSTGGAAKLFGVVDLASVLQDGLGLTTCAPQIVTTTGTSSDGKPQVVTKLHWVPAVAKGAHGPGGLLVTKQDVTTFTIDEQIVKPLTEGASGSFYLNGSLKNFDVELAKVIKLAFDSFTFTTRSGEKPHVAVSLAASAPISFEGPLEFVNQLSQVIPAGVFGDSGPSLIVSPTGVQVGYNLPLPPITVAVFALHSVTLAAALDLPFLDGKPHLDFSFSKRHDPFILTIAMLGGGGFLHLELDASGVIMVEGALEFGGEFALDIGVASGGVHIMGGVYFQLEATESDLSGFVDVAGEVSVLGIISVSVDFNLSLSYISHPGAEDKVQGRATLTVEVHVAFFTKSVDLEVERSYGSHGGDPTVGDVLNAATWQEYADAFAA